MPSSRARRSTTTAAVRLHQPDGRHAARSWRQIEDEVNARILEGAPVGCENMPLAEARKAGAMMLFGEKYPDVVRVVSMGDFSKELCGGTHLDNTGQVGLLKIVGEESVAAGTRRITALTGPAALEHVRRSEAALAEAAAVLKVPPEEVPDRVEALAQGGPPTEEAGWPPGRRRRRRRPTSCLTRPTEVGGVEGRGRPKFPAPARSALRQLIDQLRRKAAPVAVMLARRQDEGKVMLMAGLSRDLVEQGCDAVAWVRAGGQARRRRRRRPPRHGPGRRQAPRQAARGT